MKTNINMSLKLKYITTFALFSCYFFYGVNFYVVGPTLIELSALFRSTIEKICFIYTVRSAGYTLGSLSGFLFNYINRQLAFVFFMSLMGVSLLLMPHCTSLFQLFSLGAINGFSIGSFDTAINVWILEMWGEQSGPYMQALHFTYGLGSFVAPLLCEPFLSSKVMIGHHIKIEDYINTSATQDFDPNNTGVNITQFLTDDEIRSNPTLIYIPYAFAGAMTIASAAAVLVLYAYKKYEPPTVEKTVYKIANNDNKDLIKNGNKISQLKNFIKTNIPSFNTIWLVSLGALFLTFFVGMEQMHLQFLPTFAVNTDLNMSPSAAALVTSGAAAAFTVGRGLSIPLSLWLTPQVILYANHILMIAGMLILVVYANTSMVMMWTGNIILGAGLSSVYASVYAFLEQQFRVTNRIGSIFVFAGGLTAAVSPSLVGQYIEANPLILIWFNLICVGICLSILLVIHFSIYIRNRQKQAKVVDTSATTDDECLKKMIMMA
ncbi:sodium-dependent glucose transporter 1-like [Oppia nitens]|uniref:sodium-dependent glucose transporter 1-like n=1 Tax=Oppia nitens TaxID=1686743 RepID=UPI0023D9DEA9|nr:sodium-dependent glucose transporter 1-like [Oppia nitens]